ncbi:MAG: glycoside hydrolase family 9 protein [Eudoraea sp.]|uniref:glycoside hydrolase family 9 protein n=1 Tax=Eudoraea sp. TaxID=1979955 RepID=UPI003C749926
MSRIIFLYGGLVLLFAVSCKEAIPNPGDTFSGQIRLNQIGYYPNAVKKAVVVSEMDQRKFSVVDSHSGEPVFSGELSGQLDWELAGEMVRIADFSEFKKTGSYHIYIKDIGFSFPFEIKEHVLLPVFKGSIKGLYFQRASMALDEKHASQWSRPLGHPDDSVLYHPSSGKQSGSLNSPKGWYDAGDYNKYVVNASFPLGQFFLLEEQYPNSVADGDLNIPESGNGISDYLDELKYEMDWVLTMQDEDGGMFHKLTTKNFEGMVMPHEATNQKYIVGKGTAASLDFAGAAAQAARIFMPYDSIYAEKCLQAAKKAYNWSLENPQLEFVNPEDISTGQYGDTNFDDEFFWATSQLFITTSDNSYLEHLKKEDIDFNYSPGDGWTKFMRFMGIFTLLENKSLVPDELYGTFREGILNTADDLTMRTKTNDYFQCVDDFQWGSNSDVLNTAMIIAQAYRLEKKPEYLTAVRQAADYILGNNAVGYSFVTGFGDNPPMFIHHRQSAADGIVDPVPGLLSGGPNKDKQDVTDGVVYPENVTPMKSWVDHEDSYASNEICLNWNSPLTYILGFLEQESK